MNSYERQNIDNMETVSQNDIDWSRYGLSRNENRRPSRSESNRGHEELSSEMYQTGHNELFAQEFVSSLC